MGLGRLGKELAGMKPSNMTLENIKSNLCWTLSPCALALAGHHYHTLVLVSVCDLPPHCGKGPERRDLEEMQSSVPVMSHKIEQGTLNHGPWAELKLKDGSQGWIQISDACVCAGLGCTYGETLWAETSMPAGILPGQSSWCESDVINEP